MNIVKTLSFFMPILPLIAQFGEQDVRYRLDLVHSGKAGQVRSELPTLLRQYPNDPGIKYLEAYLTENGDQAVKKYQAIVDRYPESEWADESLYKVYQYYYAVALYKTADAKMAQLNTQYPNSIYATHEIVEEQKISSHLNGKKETGMSKSETASQSSAAQTVAGKFAVQVGVYSHESVAQRQSEQYTTAVGRQATVSPKISGGKVLHAVTFEGFESEQAARSFGTQLKSKFNMDWFIVKR